MTSTRTIEQFVIDYIQFIGGVSEKIEAEVYDILLPNDSISRSLQLERGVRDLLRICFDPEALSEHPDSRLLTFGDPSIESIFEDAKRRGCVSQVYLKENNLNPYQIEKKLQNAIHYSSDISLTFSSPLPKYMTSAVFWFQVTFLSDEKVQMLHPVGVDLFYGRLIRQIEEFSDSETFALERPLPYPDAPRQPLESAYELARQECLARLRAETRQFQERLKNQYVKETERIRCYFEDLRKELEEQNTKRGHSKTAVISPQEKLRSLNLEEKSRIVDLQKKLTLKVEIKLLSLLYVSQPKLLIPTEITTKRSRLLTELVWNPKIAKPEPLACPTCQQSTLWLQAAKRNEGVECLSCSKHESL